MRAPERRWRDQARPGGRSTDRARWAVRFTHVRLAAAALCLALGMSGALGCAVTPDDLQRWETTLEGPKRLRAVIISDKYPHELRVQAALSLIRMKPRKGQRIGIKLLVERTLAKLSPEARSRILADLVPLMVQELKREAPVAQPGQPLPPDPSFKFKDPAYEMLTFDPASEGTGGVIASYLWGSLSYPDAGQALWGGVPNPIRPFYTAGMLVGAAGFFAFTYFLLFRLDPAATRVFQRFSFGVFNALYAAILIRSALWMPLTIWAQEGSSLSLVWAVRVVLAVVDLASLGPMVVLIKLEPRQPRWAYRLAVAGCIGFCLQTVLLDAIVWVAFFRV